MFASGAVLIVGGLFVGTWPGAIDAAQRAAYGFFDRASYVAAVIGRPLPGRAPIEYLHPGALVVGLGIVTVLTAIGLAAVLLWRPELLVTARRVGGPGFERLRRLHSGQTGDYVAWATIGFAFLGGLVALGTQ
jgi:hypothetical protein